MCCVLDFDQIEYVRYGGTRSFSKGIILIHFNGVSDMKGGHFLGHGFRLVKTGMQLTKNGCGQNPVLFMKDVLQYTPWSSSGKP